VVRTAVINCYENGGLRVLHLETLVKACRLACFKRLYTTENASWKCYLSHLLKIFGGLFLLFHNDYDPKVYEISPPYLRVHVTGHIYMRQKKCLPSDKSCSSYSFFVICNY